jgi:hypothetical protein
MGPDVSTPREALDRVLDDFRRDLYTSFPAKVVRYDAALSTVDVDPAVMVELPGEEHEGVAFEDLGEQVNIPIQWPRAGGFVITFPLKVGDWVKVHCSIQSLLVWRGSGQVHEHPGVSDPHGLNGCWAEPGCYPDVLRVQNVSTADLVIGKEDGTAVIRMTPTGSVQVTTSSHQVGPGLLPAEGVTKDESLHRYLDVLFNSLQGIIAALTPLPGALPPAATLWTTALQAALALKSATASRVSSTE